VPAQKLKAILECLDYLLASRGLSNGTVAKVQVVLRHFPDIVAAKVGY
jgi:hypothetical protein